MLFAGADPNDACKSRSVTYDTRLSCFQTPIGSQFNSVQPVELPLLGRNSMCHYGFMSLS